MLKQAVLRVQLHHTFATHDSSLWLTQRYLNGTIYANDLHAKVVIYPDDSSEPIICSVTVIYHNSLYIKVICPELYGESQSITTTTVAHHNSQAHTTIRPENSSESIMYTNFDSRNRQFCR